MSRHESSNEGCRGRPKEMLIVGKSCIAFIGPLGGENDLSNPADSWQVQRSLRKHLPGNRLQPAASRLIASPAREIAINGNVTCAKKAHAAQDLPMLQAGPDHDADRYAATRLLLFWERPLPVQVRQAEAG
jgi:hypothetical protein